MRAPGRDRPIEDHGEVGGPNLDLALSASAVGCHPTASFDRPHVLDAMGWKPADLLSQKYVRLHRRP